MLDVSGSTVGNSNRLNAFTILGTGTGFAGGTYSDSTTFFLPLVL
jgi:hypothetical protein